MPIPTPNIAHNTEIVGDTLYNISLNYKWRQIVGGQLSRLLHRQFWDGSEAEIDTALNQLHDLIHDLYTTEPTTMAIYSEATRVTSQAIPANAITPVEFYETPVSPPFTDVPVESDGICTITARVVLDGGSGQKYASLRHNEDEILRADYRSTAILQYFLLTQVLQVEAGDTFSLYVYSLQATSVDILRYIPKISMMIVE